MGEVQSSKFIFIFLLVADLLAFGLAVAAELNRSRARLVVDNYDEYVYCVYDSDMATVYGVWACLLLGVSHVLVVLDVKKIVLGGNSDLKPGTPCAGTWRIVLFIASWLTFNIAEVCLIWGTAKNASHTKHRGIYLVTTVSCQEVPKGLFAAGAGFTMLTLVLSGLYYLVFVRVRENERSAFLISLIPKHGDHSVGIDNNENSDCGDAKFSKYLPQSV